MRMRMLLEANMTCERLLAFFWLERLVKLEDVKAFASGRSEVENMLGTSQKREELGFAGHPGWVLPLETIGGSSGSGAAEEHRRAAEWTAKLAAENRRRLAKGVRREGVADGLHQQIQKDAAERPVEVAANRWADDLDVLCFDESCNQAIVQRAEEEAVDEPQWSDDSDVSESELANVVMEMQEVTKSMPCPERPGAVPKIGAVPARAMPRQRGTQLEELHVVLVIDASLSNLKFGQGQGQVMTSNTAPQLLYTGGLNRHVHLPAFVRLVAEHSTVLGLGAKSVDYRRRAEANMESDFDAFLVGDLGAELFESKWRECVGQAPVESVTLTLPMGRYLDVPQVAGSACRLGFQELCAGDRGEADFYALADRFQTVFLSGVPKSGPRACVLGEHGVLL
eukprot:g13356.t1